jgi:hypothetical protein
MSSTSTPCTPPEIDVLPPHTIQCCPVVPPHLMGKLCPNMYHERYSSHLHVQALHPHIPILHLHALYIPERSMYFLSTQFNVVLSSQHTSWANFVLACIMSAIPPISMSNSGSTPSHSYPPPPRPAHPPEIDVFPLHTIQCCPVVHTCSKDKLCPSTYHERYSSHLYVQALHPHVPVLHALYTPRRLMYFLPTQFNVVLSSVRTTRTNFVQARIMSAIPPTSTSRLYTLTFLSSTSTPCTSPRDRCTSSPHNSLLSCRPYAQQGQTLS